jgi:hypothetical protein
MTKYTTAERIQAALAVEQGESISSVGRRLGMSPQVVRRSLRLYRQGGADGFVKQSASYNLEEKLEIMEYMHTTIYPTMKRRYNSGYVDQPRSGNGSADTWKMGLRV